MLLKLFRWDVFGALKGAGCCVFVGGSIRPGLLALPVVFKNNWPACTGWNAACRLPGYWHASGYTDWVYDSLMCFLRVEAMYQLEVQNLRKRYADNHVHERLLQGTLCSQKLLRNPQTDRLKPFLSGSLQ